MTKSTVNEIERMVVTRVLSGELDVDLARLDPTYLQEDL